MLVEPLADDQLNTVYSPILSPLAWDLGHIANFEELWLVQRVGGREPMRGELGRLYDAIENPRKVRNQLPILRGEELRSYMSEVRERTLDVLDQVELADADEPLLAGGFVYEMLLAHEHQHNETMLQLLQMVDGYEPVRVDPSVASQPVGPGPEMVTVHAGAHEVGAPPTPPPRGGPPGPRVLPTTTSAHGTRSSSLGSRSTGRRSPTGTSPRSSPTRAPSRRCTGSATATVG
jgi:gamma-glutamyl hercynylcysteine S-oxide synthase